MLTGITVLHVSGGQTIKVNAAQTFKVHFIDVGAADGALLQYGEGENAKYALIAVSYTHLDVYKRQTYREWTMGSYIDSTKYQKWGISDVASGILRK